MIYWWLQRTSGIHFCRYLILSPILYSNTKSIECILSSGWQASKYMHFTVSSLNQLSMQCLLLRVDDSTPVSTRQKTCDYELDNRALHTCKSKHSPAAVHVISPKPLSLPSGLTFSNESSFLRPTETYMDTCLGTENMCTESQMLSWNHKRSSTFNNTLFFSKHLWWVSSFEFGHTEHVPG